MFRRLLILILALMTSALVNAETFRVFISTDLGGDPDDIQSLIRLVHYSDILKVEGITSCVGPGSVPRVDLIKEWIKRTDVDHLREQGHTDLMSEAELLATVHAGARKPGLPSEETRTEGSQLLIERAHADDSRPLWVLVWGSMTDVAQALHDDPTIVDSIRVYSIASSNTQADPEARDYVYAGLEDQWPELWWIENGILPKTRETFRGVYLGGNQEGEWGNKEFIEQNIRGHGTTRGGLFDERLGDAFPIAGWPKGTLKEGDSPSMLYLMSPVLAKVGDPDDPTQPSWGGRFHRPAPERFPNYYCDLDAPMKECQATISRWRVDFLSHWKDRWDRYDEAQ